MNFGLKELFTSLLCFALAVWIAASTRRATDNFEFENEFASLICVLIGPLVGLGIGIPLRRPLAGLAAGAILGAASFVVWQYG